MSWANVNRLSKVVLGISNSMVDDLIEIPSLNSEIMGKWNGRLAVEHTG